MIYVEESDVNKCLRGTVIRYVPMYDWEYAFKLKFKMNLKYFDYMNSRKLGKILNLTIANTAKYNIETNYL